jgi:acyl-CoA-binding protein
MTTQSAEFTKAVEDSRKLTAKPTNEELLQVH